VWFHRRADEAPLPRAAEGRRTRGIYQEAADEAPMSNAAAFFSTQHVSPGGGSKMFQRFLIGSPQASSPWKRSLRKFQQGARGASLVSNNRPRWCADIEAEYIGS
jgi:hypothetical protein